MKRNARKRSKILEIPIDYKINIESLERLEVDLDRARADFAESLAQAIEDAKLSASQALESGSKDLAESYQAVTSLLKRIAPDSEK